MTLRDRTPRAPRRWPTKLSGGVMLLFCLFAGLVAFAPGASAHHPLVNTGSAVCGPEAGAWTVSGTAEAWAGDTEASRTNTDVVVYWAPASAGVAWPATEVLTVPVGAVSGDLGVFDASNGFAFDYSFVVPASSGLAVGDVIEVVAHTAGPWGSGNAGGQWWGMDAGTPIDVVLTSQTDCVPPPCEFDPTLPADDPACGECEEGEVGEFPDCAPACETDPTLPADDPACGECEEGEVGEFPDCAPACEGDPMLPAADPSCEEEVLGNVVTPGAQLPATGSHTGPLVTAAALLLTLGGLLLVVGRRRERHSG